jgi:hypothetical protein
MLLVIPGRREAASPESNLLCRELDSGLALELAPDVIRGRAPE